MDEACCEEQLTITITLIPASMRNKQPAFDRRLSAQRKRLGVCAGIYRPNIRLRSGLPAILSASRVTLGTMTHDIRSACPQCGHFGAADAVLASAAGLKFHADLVFCATQVKRSGFLHVGGGYIFLDTLKLLSHLYVSLSVSSTHQCGIKSCNGRYSTAVDCGQVLR